MTTQQDHLTHFKHYIQGLSKIKNDLTRIKKITDTEQKYNEAIAYCSEHYNKYSLAHSHYNNGKL